MLVFRLFGAAVIALTLVALPSVALAAPYCQPGQTPRFQFGFAALASALGSSLVGIPTTCELTIAGGSVNQYTSTGLMAYVPSQNASYFWRDANVQIWQLGSDGQVSTAVSLGDWLPWSPPVAAAEAPPATVATAPAGDLPPTAWIPVPVFATGKQCSAWVTSNLKLMPMEQSSTVFKACIDQEFADQLNSPSPLPPAPPSPPNYACTKFGNTVYCNPQ